MTPLVAYLLGLMTFPTAMGMVFVVKLMQAAVEQARKEVDAEIEAEKAEEENHHE